MPFFLYLFTFWVIILTIFHKQTFKCVNLLYLTFIVFICGLYISYINPKYYIYETQDNETIIINGFNKFYIVDIFAHTIPFLFIYYTYRNYYANTSLLDTPFTFLFILLGFLLINSKEVYNISRQEVVLLYLVATILYFFL